MHIASWPIASLFLHTASFGWKECNFVLYSDTFRLILRWYWKCEYVRNWNLETSISTYLYWVYFNNTLHEECLGKGNSSFVQMKAFTSLNGEILRELLLRFIKVSDGALGHFVQNNFLSIYRWWMLFRCRTVALGSLKKVGSIKRELQFCNY